MFISEVENCLSTYYPEWFISRYFPAEVYINRRSREGRMEEGQRLPLVVSAFLL